MKKILVLFLLVMFAIICFNINPVSAQQPGTPYIESIVPYTIGTDTVLNITVLHPTNTGEYNPLNFVDHLDIEIDEAFPYIMVSTADIQSIHFSVQYNMGELTEPCSVRVRPVNLQNMGLWSELIVVPEFSLIHLVPILAVISIVILLMKSKITAKSK